VAAVLTEPLDTWHWRNPAPTGNRLHGIGASPSRYVAVGEFGTIIASDNGTDWWQTEPRLGIPLRAVTWGNGLWVAVGDFGEVLTSTDGVAWTPRPTAWFFNLTAVTWGGGQFVAVGENTAILSSPDGIQWTLRASGSHPLRAVTWAKGLFVAAGGEPPRIEPGPGGFGRRVPGQPLVLVSSDGATWNRVEAPVAGQISCLAFGAGRFAAGTTSMATMISTNGTEWVSGYEPDYNFGFEFFAMAHVGDRYIATYGNQSTIPGNYMVSEEGVRWTHEIWTLGIRRVFGNVRALAVNSHGIAGVARGFDYSFHPVIWSEDGHRWRRVERRLPDFETPLVYAGGRFFLREVSAYVTPYEQRTETTYLVSSEGQKWESTVVSEMEWFGLPAYGNGMWLAGGDNGQVAVSTNAVNWRMASTGEINQLLHTTFAGGSFFLAGVNGTLLSSTDGVDWSRRPVDSTNTLGPVLWNNGTFAFVEIGATRVFTSTDSMVWTAGVMPTNVTVIETLTGWQEGFLALVRTSQYSPALLLRSTDGRSWSDEQLPADGVSSIATGGDYLLAFHGSGSPTFHARRNAETNWTTHVLPWIVSIDGVTYYAPAGVAFGDGTFLLTHSGGFLLQSDALTNTAPRITQPLAVVAVNPATPATLKATARGSMPLRYQWRRGGTNIPSATSPYLTLPAGEVAANRFTVLVENDFGSAESGAATIAWAEPATLEIASDLASVRVRGTPNGRYQIEFTPDVASGPVWRLVDEVEIPSFGGPARVKNISAYDYQPVPHRFYRAVARP
jgi:hypothetical protein